MLWPFLVYVSIFCILTMRWVVVSPVWDHIPIISPFSSCTTALSYAPRPLSREIINIHIGVFLILLCTCEWANGNTHPLGHCKSGRLPKKFGKKRWNWLTLGLTTPSTERLIHFNKQFFEASVTKKESVLCVMLCVCIWCCFFFFFCRDTHVRLQDRIFPSLEMRSTDDSISIQGLASQWNHPPRSSME